MLKWIKPLNEMKTNFVELINERINCKSQAGQIFAKCSHKSKSLCCSLPFDDSYYFDTLSKWIERLSKESNIAYLGVLVAVY